MLRKYCWCIESCTPPRFSHKNRTVYAILKDFQKLNQLLNNYYYINFDINFDFYMDIKITPLSF